MSVPGASHDLLTGAAINLARIDAWLSGTGHARTRVSCSAALQQSEG
ncbi:hypothetical protein OG782_03620 [Streptomyces sp. NBC_00876]|nr:hypothetical protein OG782_03620 [Streptomyces sp. NBC_00876]